VSQSSEVEESDAITQPRADGTNCVNIAGERTFSYHELEIQLCEVDPHLVQIIDPTAQLIYDGEDVVGIATGDSEGLLTRTGFALELWLGTAAEGDICSGVAQQGQWGYLLYPRISGATEGDLTIENAAITFAFTGRTTAPNGWRRGPYSVWSGTDGIPCPLPEIMPSTKHRLLLPVVHVPPPEAECGCQPVDRPIPDEAELLITGLPSEQPRRTVRLRVNNHGFGPVMVDWGDGSQQEVADGATVSHVYAEDGQYTITVRDKQTPAVMVQRQVTIPLPADEPTLELSCSDPEGNPFEVLAVVGLPSHASRDIELDWGDGSERETATVGDTGTVSLVHLYSVPGIYPIAVRRVEADVYRTRDAIQVPCVPGPGAQVNEDTSDTTGMTVLLSVDNHGDGPTQIDWDDATSEQGPDAGEVPHQYATAGTYDITVSSVANPAARTTVSVEVPFEGGGQNGPVVEASADPSDASGHTVLLDIDNTGTGDGGDGGPEVTAAADPEDPERRTVELDIDNTAP
jgi:hypothetical protein